MPLLNERRTGKCHSMLINAIPATSPLKNLIYILNNHVLTKVHHHSYLGVILSEDLKWSEHIVYMTSSTNRTLGIIGRNFRNVSVDCKSKLYHSLVRPKIEYANSAWYPYLQKEIHHPDMIQRSAARPCFKNYSKEPGEVTDMLNKLEWPSFEGRRILLIINVSSDCLSHC